MGGDTLEVDIDYIAIGKRIRSARLAKKMTQETLSNMIDVTPTYISTIENGHTKLSLSTLLSIAQILDTTVDQLLYDNTPVLISQFDADIKELTSDCSKQEKDFLLENNKINQGGNCVIISPENRKSAEIIVSLHSCHIALRSCFLAFLKHLYFV